MLFPIIIHNLSENGIHQWRQGISTFWSQGKSCHSFFRFFFSSKRCLSANLKPVYTSDTRCQSQCLGSNQNQYQNAFQPKKPKHNHNEELGALVILLAFLSKFIEQCAVLEAYITFSSLSNSGLLLIIILIVLLVTAIL